MRCKAQLKDDCRDPSCTFSLHSNNKVFFPVQHCQRWTKTMYTIICWYSTSNPDCIYDNVRYKPRESTTIVAQGLCVCKDKVHGRVEKSSILCQFKPLKRGRITPLPSSPTHLLYVRWRDCKYMIWIKRMKEKDKRDLERIFWGRRVEGRNGRRLEWNDPTTPIKWLISLITVIPETEENLQHNRLPM